MNVYEIVTDRIIEQLEKRICPWRQPWNGQARPANAISKRPYTGINFFLLGCAPATSPYWATFKQIKELGGTVKAGQHSEIVVFWKIYKDEEETDDNGKPTRRFVLRYYRVFNLDQCDLPAAVKERYQVEHGPGFDRLEAAQEVINHMPYRPEMRFGGQRACYQPSNDTVYLPPHGLFRSAQGFYETAFHELGHSTGHPKRLNRFTESEGPGRFGSDSYSREELVAELSAAFLCAEAGISNETIENSAAYLKGWLDTLKADKRLIVSAAGAAQKAADYILDRNQIQETNPPQ